MRPRLHPQHRSRETYPPRPQQQLRLRRPEYLADRQSVLGVSRGLVLGWPKPDGEPAAGGGGVSQLAVLRAAPKLPAPDDTYLPGEALFIIPRGQPVPGAEDVHFTTPD